jgi:FMN-dependent NADH-azoreductase
VKGFKVRILSILASPRPDSVSTAIVDTFLSTYRRRQADLTIDTLDVWKEQLPEFGAESIGAKYKRVSGVPMSTTEQKTWDSIERLASRFKNTDRIVLGVPMWNFSYPYKLKQLIDLSCQRNMLFTFDGKAYRPALAIDKAFVVYVRGQGHETGINGMTSPGFAHMSDYMEFWLRFIGVRDIVTLTVEHTWDGRAGDEIAAAKIRATEMAEAF